MQEHGGCDLIPRVPLYLPPRLGRERPEVGKGNLTESNSEFKKILFFVDLGSSVQCSKSKRSKNRITEFSSDDKQTIRGWHILTISPSPNIENLPLSCILKTNCHLKSDNIINSDSKANHKIREI